MQDAELVQVDEDAEHLARDVAEHRFAERPSCDPRGERLALDELGREVEAQLDALALGKTGDEPGNARMVQSLQRRSFALEGVDLRRPRHTGELELLEGDDLAIGRMRAVHASVGTLRKHALHAVPAGIAGHTRSEEHTSELQSQSNLVCRLLLENKKQ